jgi:prepilin-type N-terminal cleavage/methylation domain-containing protein
MTPRSLSRRAGFTLFELLIVIVVGAVVSLVAIASLSNQRSRTDLDLTAKKMSAALRDAASRSIAQERGTSWGVRFENASGSRPFFAVFWGSYSTTTIAYRDALSPHVTYLTSTIPSGSAVTVTFSQLTGEASASTTIGLVLVARSDMRATLSIASSGAIAY